MRHCDKCNINYSDESQYCSKCGAVLSYHPELINRRQVFSILNALPGYKRILQNCPIKNYDEHVFFDFILIHETGIFAFQIAEAYQIISGNDKMRYWMAAARGNKGSTLKIERPVAVLEKDHAILDQVIRKYTFARSFAFLIYPENSGLERVITNHLDQMLTIPRTKGILLDCINRYGHAYSKEDIDKVYDILRKMSLDVEGSSQKRNVKKQPKEQKNRHGIRIFAVFSLLFIVFISWLYISNHSNFSEMFSRFPENFAKPQEVPQPNNNISVFQQTIPNGYMVYTIPSEYSSLYSSISQDSLNQTSAALGFRSFQLQSDGSISCVLKEENKYNILTAMDSAFQKTMDTLFSENAIPHFTSVRTNDHTQYVIFLLSETFNAEESIVIGELFRLAVLNAALEEQPIRDISVRFLSQAGLEYSKLSLLDYLRRN